MEDTMTKLEAEAAKARNCGLPLKEYQRRVAKLLRQCREALEGK
jgi:hypothetical protein